MLLTFFDMSARTHYLNARQTLRRLLDWRVVPVINENDTTTTDEISFGDNDFLAAQVAILVGADRLVLLTDTDGLYTADPRTDPRRRLVDEVDDFAALEALEIGHDDRRRSGSGGMRSKVVAAEMATAAGIPTVDLQRPARRRARRGARRARPSGTRFAPQRARYSSLQAVAEVRQARARARSSSTPARRARCARAARRCCRSGSSTCAATSTPATPSRCADGDGVVGKGIATTRPTELRRVMGLKSRRGARGAAARHRRGRPPRLLRADLSARFDH